MASIIQVDGQWRAQVRRRGHKAQTRTFENKSVAERWARKVERQIDTGEFNDNGEAKRTTVKDLIDRFKLERANEIGRSHGYALVQIERRHGDEQLPSIPANASSTRSTGSATVDMGAGAIVCGVNLSYRTRSLEATNRR